MALETPPRPNEFEISLLGPGFGESVVIHIGDNQWIVVDSCLNVSRDSPASLEYFNELGVDVAKQVKLVVATHWDDDHIRGLSDILAAADSATFACSQALRCEEFFKVVFSGDDAKFIEDTSNVKEFSEIIKILQSRAKGRYAASPVWASNTKTLYSTTTPRPTVVTALSPSDHTITDSQVHFAKLLPKTGTPLRRVPSQIPNNLSVVLLVHNDMNSFLLGGDLQTVADPYRGWNAILSCQLRPQRSSGVIKIAHHGSHNGDHDGIWESLVDRDGVGMIAPFVNGSVQLPKETDLERLRAKTANLYCTAYPPTKNPPKRKIVDLTLSETTRSRRAIRDRPGHIRIRMPVDGHPSAAAVELFHGARKL